MIVRQTKNSMYNIQKLRNIYVKANEANLVSVERISLINKILRKLIIRNILLKIITLFIYSYKKETIKLGLEEINEEKKRISNNMVAFEYNPSQSSYIIDKLIVLITQLRKMRVFYRLDGTFFSYDQIDLQDISKHYFQLITRKDAKIIFEDEANIFEFNSLFVSKYNKKGEIQELFSYDNIKIETKEITYASKSKKAGLILDKETWLYHLDNGDKDEKFSDNYPIYIYKFKMVKIIFNGKNASRDFVFLGNDFEKMNLFVSLIEDYLRCLKNVYYEILDEKNFSFLSQDKILEMFYDNPEYSWVIFKILNSADGSIQLSDIRRTYKLTCNDVLDIVHILKKYQFINVSLGLDLIPLYKKTEINNYEQHLKYYLQARLMRGQENG